MGLTNFRRRAQTLLASIGQMHSLLTFIPVRVQARIDLLTFLMTWRGNLLTFDFCVLPEKSTNFYFELRPENLQTSDFAVVGG